jgi:hypothetical protein
MTINDLLKRLEGIHTIETVMDTLHLTKQKAIYAIYRLRKNGYVKTKTSGRKKVYHISFENRLNGTSYIDIINKHSPIKIATSTTHLIYGKIPSTEETLIYAIKTQSVRTILAALALFRTITDWAQLYQLAKKNHLERQVGALYDVARKVTLVRRMTKRFRNNALPQQSYEWRYVVPGLQSDDFKNIEKVWKVYLPFNKKDLEEYT